MIVDSSYYILSLILVVLMSLIRDFIIPSIVWHGYLRDKSYTYKFFFYIISQGIIQINLILFLGLLNICNRFTLMFFNILIYGLIMWNYSNKAAYSKKKIFIDFIKLRNIKLRMFIKNNFIELLAIAIISIYNMWFLSYNTLNYHSYQFSDIPVHQSWIYDLEKGRLFSQGVYPFGMHIMIYYIRAIFNYDLREILLYAGAYQTVILSLVMYLFAKKIFANKYLAFGSLFITSMMINQGRFAASLPQEFGMYAVVCMAYFLIKYLHQDKEKLKIKKDNFLKIIFSFNRYINRNYFNNDLIFFLLSVTLVINYHFYTAIAAIFLVLSIAIGYLLRILKKQYLVPILCAGFLGGMLAVLPIAVALFKGIPFQESMAWATTVMSGKEWKGSDTKYEDALNEALGNLDKTNQDKIENEKHKIDYSSMNTKEIILHVYNSIYQFANMSMYGDKATNLMFISILIGLIFATIMLTIKETSLYASTYISLIIYILILSVFGAATSLGIAEIIAAARASTFAEPFIGIIYLIPIDAIFRIVSLVKVKNIKRIVDILSLITCMFLCILVFKLELNHSFFDVNQAYYNESEFVLRNIKKTYKKDEFTIVATTDEYYEVIDYGRHTEISKFINMVDKNEGEFTFPTKYVFFFVEKLVLDDYNYGRVYVSRELASKKFAFLQDTQDYYFQRAVIQSKAYYWAEEFAKIYPRNFKVFFENDIYIVYRLEQNTYSPFKMQIVY